MACAPVQSGQRFVAQMIGHIDCQAQAIGAYGYGALSDPSSSIALAFTGMLTLFVALFGLRLMMGQMQSGRDLVGDMLRIGIVLTLATSWPAWRTLGYNVVVDGPSQLAATIGGAADLPGGQNDLVGRLQAADDNIVILTIYGTGRNTGGTDRSDQIGDSFRGIAIADQEGLANGRFRPCRGQPSSKSGTASEPSTPTSREASRTSSSSRTTTSLRRRRRTIRAQSIAPIGCSCTHSRSRPSGTR